MMISESDRFESILALEQEVRLMAAVEAFAPATARLAHNGGTNGKTAAAQARLFAAIDALTPAELVAFGEYRKVNA